jgi:tRNA (mo5U34)-methyltransferase
MITNPPANFDAKSFFADIYWHQKWNLFPTIETPGLNDVQGLLARAKFPEKLDGKRVLDVGTWNGCFSFEAERRGAAEVVALGPDPMEATGALKLKKLLQSTATDFRYGTIYDLNPGDIGQFDVVMCFGVLYHLRHPLLALDNLYKICRDTLYLETEITPDFHNESACKFFRRDELNNDESNWFAPNRRCLEDLLFSSGFQPRHIDDSLPTRATLECQMDPLGPEWLRHQTSEGSYYEIITRPVLGPRKYFN